MNDQVTKPIFVVGSPRSETTVLAYCICQHPNILYQEEADWLGPFAIDAAVNHRRGSARGPRGQLSANGVGREEFLMSFGQTINELILSHRKQFQTRRAQWDLPPFTISRSPEEPKSRWVAGAPENSFYVCRLRKLFPQALFIRLVRDVRDVVRSLLNFFPDGRNRLIANEQDAYDIWLRRYFHDLGRNYREAQRLIISLLRELEHVKASAAGACVT
jgi:Sulfotransferase family